MKPSQAGQRAFEEAVVRGLRQAWTERMGLLVRVADEGGDAVAELSHRGEVVWSQRVPGVQLALPLPLHSAAAPTPEAPAPAPAAKATEVSPPQDSPQPVENPSPVLDAPTLTRCMILSIDAPDDHRDDHAQARAWAVAHNVHRVGPGVLYWWHEGGGTRGGLRLVASIEREFVPLVVAVLGEALQAVPHDGPSTLLCVGRPVVDEATGDTWYVTDVTADAIVVKREGARLDPGGRILPAHAFEHRWLPFDYVHQWTILRAFDARRAPRVVEGTPAELGEDLCKTLHGGPLPDGMVCVTVDHERVPPRIDLYDGTLVLWTFEGDGIEEDTTLRTIVPASLAPAVRARVGAAWLREAAADPALPSHAVRVGDAVHVVERRDGAQEDTPVGTWTLVGVAEVADNVPGLVLDAGQGETPAVAWADTAQVRDGRLEVRASAFYTAQMRNTAWVVLFKKAPAKKAPAKKAPAKKAPAKKAAAPAKKALAPDSAEARRAKAGYAEGRGVVFVTRAGLPLRCKELDPAAGGIGSVSGGSLGPWRLHGPVDPGRSKLLAAIRKGLAKHEHFEVPDVDVAGAEAWLRERGHLGPAEEPTPAKPAKGKGKARNERVPDADRLARRGASVCVALPEGEARWRVVATRTTETAPAWQRLAEGHAQGARVRLYDRQPRCVWDSSDGGWP